MEKGKQDKGEGKGKKKRKGHRSVPLHSAWAVPCADPVFSDSLYAYTL